MKESVWRTKLVAMRKATNPTDFIWPMDAKFKAPDKMSLDDIKDTAKRMLGQYPARSSK